MYDSKEIANNIRQEARRKGISLGGMLDAAGLGRNTMSNLNTSMLRADSLGKIADCLGCTVDRLLGRCTLNLENEPLRESQRVLLESVAGLSDVEIVKIAGAVPWVLEKQRGTGLPPEE